MISINEMSSILQVHPNTLRNWEREFNIIVERDVNGSRKYGENTVSLFKKIKLEVDNSKSIDKVKRLMDEEIGTHNGYIGRFQNSGPKVEVVQDEPEEKQNFDLVLKPYTDRIKQLEIVESKYISLVEETATLKERVKNKDEIIAFKDSLISDRDARIQELKNKLDKFESKKWWQVWK